MPFVRTEMNLIGFSGPRNCVNTQHYLELCTRSALLIIFIFLIAQPKHMLWVLKRTLSMSPQNIYVKPNTLKIFCYQHKHYITQPLTRKACTILLFTWGLGVTNEKCIRIIKTNIMIKAGPEIIKQEIIKLLSCSTQLTAQNLK